MGTDYVTCGNRLQNLWEQIMQKYIFMPLLGLCRKLILLKSITVLPVAVPHGAKVTSYCISFGIMNAVSFLQAQNLNIK